MGAVERFWANVIPEPNTGCWIWLGHLDLWGYGRFRDYYKRVRAHRFSYQLHNYPISDDIQVLHRCDQPWCVNPEHLFIGSHADNMRDKTLKKRHIYGERHKKAKLTDDDVRSIRRSLGTERWLAKQYGVSASLIHMIRKRKTWTHITDIQDEHARRP